MARPAANLAKALMPVAVCILLPCAGWAENTASNLISLSKHKSGTIQQCVGLKNLVVRTERQAQIEVINSHHSTAIRVLQGSVIVRNQLDRSVIRLEAGSAYETNFQAHLDQRQPQAYLDKANETLALFETKSNTSFLYVMQEDRRLKAEIISPPSTMSYSIGDVASARLPMSRMSSMNFPPSGVVVWHAPTPALAEQSKPQ